MDLSKYLASTQLMDCNGQITHTFTLLPDGNVEVVMGSLTAVVDPIARVVTRPAGVTLPAQVFDQALVLRREAMS